MRETATRKVAATLESSAWTLSFAPHAGLLACGDPSGVKLWSTETWQKVRSLPGAMHPARFSPDERWLVTGVAGTLGVAGAFRVWDTQTWQAVGVCPSAPRAYWHLRNAVAFSPDSQFLVTIASKADAELGDHLRVWRLPGLAELPTLQFNGELPSSVAFSADGKHLVTGLMDGQVLVWDFATRQVVATRKEHTGMITAVAVAPDGKTFATSSSDRTISLWDGVTFNHLGRLRGHVGEVWSVALSPDGRTVVSGSADGTTKLWNADTRDAERVLDGYYFAAGFLGGGRQVVAARSDGLCVWTPETGARVDFLIPTNPPLFTSVAAKPYDVHPMEPLGALGRTDGTVELWHLKTGAKVSAWPAHRSGIGVVAFSPDGKRLATGSTNGGVIIWEIATRQEVAQLQPVGRPLICLAFSPDGKTLAASGKSSRVWLWDLTTDLVRHLGGHGSVVPSLAFSPDGTLLATTVASANEARLWELPSGKQVATLKGHLQGVLAVAFSPDGKTLATGGMDRKVKLWNVATHQELATLPMGGPFPMLRFSPDGRTLAIGNLHEAGRRIQILRAPSFEEIAAAEAKPRDVVNP